MGIAGNFCLMASHRKIVLKEYLVNFLRKHPECEIHVGCDSQNYSRTTVYVTTIVIRFPNQGAHVLYHKEKVDKINDLWTRLWNEIEKSISIANFIQQECSLKVTQIDLDLNEDPVYPSHKVLKAANGYLSSLGFNAKAKPNLLMATWAANALCH